VRRLDNVPRVSRLIDDAISRLDLRLDGLRVLTEAASGPFVVTSLIAARAGAERVWAVTRDSAHGTAAEVLRHAREWAAALGVARRVEFYEGQAIDCASGVDVVTNLGFVRPIDAATIARLPAHAAISLMWEPWEFRPEDVDAQACAAAGIPVIGTNESDPRLRTFDYVGTLAAKLLFESGLEGRGNTIVVLGSDPFGRSVCASLEAIGAHVERVVVHDDDLDGRAATAVEKADALVVAEHRDRRELIGNHGGIRPARLHATGCRVIHIAGHVDVAALEEYRVAKHPHGDAVPGHMTVATDYLGARPVIDLHAAGLRVGADAVRCRMRGGSLLAALQAAESSGLGIRLPQALPELES
jgi:hypothetical protein